MRMSALVIGALLALISPSSNAATAQFAIIEDGGNLLVSGSGAFDLDGLENFGLSFGNQGALVSIDPASIGFVPDDSHLFGIVTTVPVGPGPFGMGNAQIDIPILGGDVIAFAMNVPADNDFLVSFVVVPQGYQSGAPLSNSLVLPDARLSEFGLKKGTYLYPIGNNDISVTVGRAVVPLPASGILLTGAILSVVGIRSRKTGPERLPARPKPPRAVFSTSVSLSDDHAGLTE